MTGEIADREHEALLSLKTKYLDRVGWTNSVLSKRAVNAKGDPLLWITYPAIHFITQRIRPDLSVFEYGSGSSTLWWASRAKDVVSVEHHESWYKAMLPKIPDNVAYVYRDIDGTAYPEEILGHSSRFDVVMVDGRKRVRSAIASAGRLSSGGLIIWDNSERPYYQPGFEYLSAKGFRRLDFEGLGPARDRAWLTSVFYRPDNCFGI